MKSAKNCAATWVFTLFWCSFSLFFYLISTKALAKEDKNLLYSCDVNRKFYVSLGGRLADVLLKMHFHLIHINRHNNSSNADRLSALFTLTLCIFIWAHHNLMAFAEIKHFFFQDLLASCCQLMVAKCCSWTRLTLLEWWQNFMKCDKFSQVYHVV